MGVGTRAAPDVPYDEHRRYVLGVLARRCRWLEPDEREEILHDAYMVLLEKTRSGTLDLDGMAPAQVRAYFAQTAINKALDEGKRAGRTRSQPLDDHAYAEPDGHAAPDELAAAHMDSARVREIVAELSERQQVIVKLRFFFDRTPEEIQRFLGITERAYRRDLERALRLVSERYELVRAGTFCDSRRSLIRAYVAGIAGPNKAREAREHLATCPACSRFAFELRHATDQIAIWLPAPAVLTAHRPFEHLLEVLTGARDQAASAAARVDPSSPVYAAGVRPGAVAAAVAGCLAIGGGATYCAFEGLPAPVRGVLGHETAAKAEKAPPKRRPVHATPRAPATQVARPVVAVAPKTTTTTVRHTTTSSTRTRKRTSTSSTSAKQAAIHREAVATTREFGLEGSGTQVSGGSSTSTSTSTSSAPKRPASDGQGEFGP